MSSEPSSEATLSLLPIVAFLKTLNERLEAAGWRSPRVSFWMVDSGATLAVEIAAWSWECQKVCRIDQHIAVSSLEDAITDKSAQFWDNMIHEMGKSKRGDKP